MDRILVYVSKKIRKSTINNYPFVIYELKNSLTFLIGFVTSQIQYTKCSCPVIRLISYIMTFLHQNWTGLGFNSLHLSCIAVMQTNSSDRQTGKLNMLLKRKPAMNILILGQGDKIQFLKN